jgi:hypothetical protein
LLLRAILLLWLLLLLRETTRGGCSHTCHLTVCPQHSICALAKHLAPSRRQTRLLRAWSRAPANSRNLLAKGIQGSHGLRDASVGAHEIELLDKVVLECCRVHRLLLGVHRTLVQLSQDIIRLCLRHWPWLYAIDVGLVVLDGSWGYSHPTGRGFFR